MDPVPHIWPPNLNATLPSGPVPMFPLAGVFLFPGQILPLNIFEPRYLQMIEDSLDGPGRMVIGTILEGHGDDLANPPPVLPICGLGEIARHQKQPDGRFVIWVFGVSRVGIDEVPSNRLYRKVMCSEFSEVNPSNAELECLQGPLVEAIRSRIKLPISAKLISIVQLADILAQCLAIPQSRKEEIYTEAKVAVRVERLLAAHVEFPPPPATDQLNLEQ
jgi:Lon protease-like protein